MTPCVLLAAAGATFALPMSDLAEVVPPSPVTRVPGLPDWLPGLTGWRGRLLAVADLARIAGGSDPVGVVAVVRRGEMELGLACAEVVGALDIDLADAQQVPARVSPELAALLVGSLVHEGTPVALLDTGALLTLRHRLPAREAVAR